MLRTLTSEAMISTEGLPAVRLHTQGADFLEQTHFLGRGEPQNKDGVATPGFLQALKKITAADRATLRDLHATTTGYMRALAQLAGEDAYSVSPGIGKISRAIRASDALGITKDHVRAYETIAERVSDWVLAARQARDVRHLVTENGARQRRMAGALDYGMVAVNRVKITGAPIPFGGVKQSGLGREGSRHGLEAFTELKYICLDLA